MGYIFFCVPDIADGEKEILKNRIEKPINDVLTNPTLTLILELENNKNLNISVDSPKFSYELKLNLIKECKSGLFIYEISDKLEDININLLKRQVFHYFKSFFHEHIFHDDDEDTILGEAYIGIKYDSSEIKKAIEYYIEIYRFKFKTIHTILDDSSISNKNILENSIKRGDTLIEIKRLFDIKLRDIRRVKGELIFADYCARFYQREFKNYKYIDIFAKEERHTDIIEKDILNKLEELQILYTSLYNDKQDQLAQLSISLGLLGVGLGLFTFNLDTSKFFGLIIFSIGIIYFFYVISYMFFPSFLNKIKKIVENYKKTLIRYYLKILKFLNIQSAISTFKEWFGSSYFK